MKKVWEYLNGKKTIIAATYWTIVVPVLAALYPDGYPKSVIVITAVVGAILSSLGLGHKIVKARND